MDKQHTHINNQDKIQKQKNSQNTNSNSQKSQKPHKANLYYSRHNNKN